VRLHLTRQKLSATESPDGFVGYLRKNLEGKTAQEIRQHGNDRILEIVSRSKEKLIFELFRKGNIILVGEDGTIAACCLAEEAGGRKIARGCKYEHPKATAFEIKMPEKIAFCVQENEKGEPVSFSSDESKGGRKFDTFSEAADHYYANQKEESGEQKSANEKVKKLQERLESQVQSLQRLGEEKKEAAGAGEAIYANFELVEELLAKAREMKKSGKSEEEINRSLAQYNAKMKGAEIEIELDA